MSKMWYPVINKEKCIDCMECIKKCSHGVYEVKNGDPYVANPDNCVQNCHGCQKICPTEAIEYVGETGKNEPSICSCGG